MKKTIDAIYSSWWGNTRLVLERVQELLAKERIDLILHNAITAHPEDLTRHDITILAAPTYDHGILHYPFAKLLQQSEDLDLTDYSYAVIGLGDNKYDAEYTVESAQILEEFVITHQWNLICEPLKINKHPIDQLTGNVEQRAQQLIQKIV